MSTFNPQGVWNVLIVNFSTGFIPLTVDALQAAGLKMANTQNYSWRPFARIHIQKYRTNGSLETLRNMFTFL